MKLTPHASLLTLNTLALDAHCLWLAEVDNLDDLPQILAEPEPLRQVVGNILVNAADAIADRGTITVSTALQDGMVSITIADTGRGIPAENLQRIFNPFFTTKGGGRGTGLGLSIAASIVKYMGGTIKVNSIPGAGSSFTILLPVK